MSMKVAVGVGELFFKSLQLKSITTQCIFQWKGHMTRELVVVII